MKVIAQRANENGNEIAKETVTVTATVTVTPTVTATATATGRTEELGSVVNEIATVEIGYAETCCESGCGYVNGFE